MFVPVWQHRLAVDPGINISNDIQNEKHLDLIKGDVQIFSI
jgi:hypothetical protein